MCLPLPSPKRKCGTEVARVSNAEPPAGIRVKLEVVCIDKNSGEILWRRTAYEGASKVVTHGGSPYSANSNHGRESCVRLFWNDGIDVYSMDGELVWEKEMGDIGWTINGSAGLSLGGNP